MNADGSNPIRLTDHPAVDRSPSWSPDGTKIVFWSDRDGNAEIYLLDLQTRQLKNLTNHPSVDLDPSWSPDSSRIVFVSNRDGLPKIYTINPDGTGVINLNVIAGLVESRPVYSPDGRKILFWSGIDETGRFDATGRAGEVYVINKDGSDLKNLTQRVGRDDLAVWSPDGSQIAFLSDRNPPGTYLMRADGSDVRLLSRLSAEPHAWASPSLIVGVEAKSMLTTSWGKMKANR